MLKGKNVVIVKGEKGSEPIVKEYDRVYLEFGAGDPVESFDKTIDGKDLTVDGKKWEGTRPKTDSISSVPTDKLVEDALAYFGERYPKSNPYTTLLEAASYGADLWERNSIQASIRPSKPVDKATVIQKMVKMLLAMNPKMTQAKALRVATAAAEAEAEAEEEQAA